MFKDVKTKPRMTPDQETTEQEAIRLLTHAQQLLIDDDNNVDEAKRIRFDVTDRLLPPHRMYIVGKHPRSLLKDIDRRINFAYFRLTQQGIVQSTLEEEEEKSQPVLHKTQRAKDDIYIGQPMKFDYDKINQSIQSRYKKTEQRIDGQVFRALGWLFFLLLGLAAVYLMTRSFYGTNELYNSFHWLPR